MKYKIIMLIILFPVFALAQTAQTPEVLARNVLSDLEDSWTLGIDSNSDAVDIRVYNKYKSLFDINAKVADEFNAVYQPESSKDMRPYKIDTTPKSFDVYAHDVALQVKKLIISKVDTLSINFNDFNNMVIEIRRTVYAEKAGLYVLPGAETYASDIINSRSIAFNDAAESKKVNGILKSKITGSQGEIYQFTSTATLRITMAFKNDTVKIKSIENINGVIDCTNDADLDAIFDRDDKFNDKDKRGDFTAEGRPDYDLDGVPDEVKPGDKMITDKCRTTYGIPENQGCPSAYFFNKYAAEGYIGLQFNSAKINLPELNQLGYRKPDAQNEDAMDTKNSLSKKGELNDPKTAHFSLCIGGNFSYYFGNKSKKHGISIGFNYTKFTASYNVSNPIVYTFKASDLPGSISDTNYYRRRITIRKESSEDINYNIINLPVLYTYRGKFSDKWSYQLSAGPSIMLFRNSSRYNMNIDFEGLYQVDTTTNPDLPSITYDDDFKYASDLNVYFTADNILAHGGDSNTVYAVFESLNNSGYDFAFNKNYSGTQKNLNRITVAINLKFDVIYNIPVVNNKENIAVKCGLQFAYAPLFQDNSKTYNPIDSTKEDYKSLYNSKSKGYYSSYGINAGIVYGF